MDKASLDAEWERCRPYLEAALRRGGRHSGDNIEAVKADVYSGRAHLWPGRESAVVTCFSRDLHFWLAGGSLPELIKGHADAEHFARLNGCERMTMIGRPGWERVMAPLGYKPLVVLAKDL